MEQVFYRAGHKLIEWYTRQILRMDLYYKHTLPEGPYILAANHPTTVDPFYLLALEPHRMSILVTQMAFNVPVFGGYLRRAGHIPVIRDRGKEAFRAGIDLLKNGGKLGIFPEGSLSPKEGGFYEPRTGTVRMALEAGVPIVPIGIGLDKRRIRYQPMSAGDYSETARWYPFGPYAMTIGKAIKFSGSVDNWAYVRSASNALMEQIKVLSHESTRRLRRPVLVRQTVW